MTTGRRGFLIAALAVAGGAGCGGRGRRSAALGPSPELSPATPSVSPAATMTPLSPEVPPLSDAARSAGFVDVRTVVPDGIIDLRYATSNNFTGAPLYPPDARCLVHETLAPGLATAAGVLRSQGVVLVFWDGYRPHEVQVKMFEVVSNPAWVARPGPYARSHESGRSVDVTIAGVQEQCPPERQVGGFCLLDMGTDLDDFSPRGMAYATDGVSAEAQANRARLRKAMMAGGFTPYSGEWWHFDGPGASIERPILDVPVV
ncbi:MAG: D-alanyl-D-alanine dipeptidase [Mycobacteriaceae bacterium]|nr:D-alanyl-D-alanine dipeptidase [Mycobacteriaceae bacterium]MBV9638749.1 D-alanyl-D-alanine dipeptidase [Mycobacteriaceae bacterium]